jgi:hypothetical protein|mmetsp:Transcript_17969/g.32575  ORF Transcript_17969/g.32575 Transcript_17969/m.32575 type:complete len:191 (+) Transcript_17969:1583-2155(+)
MMMRCCILSLSATATIPWAHGFRASSMIPWNGRSSFVDTRLFANMSGGPPSSMAEVLCHKAKDFIEYKNRAGRGDDTLDPVFDMCAPNANLYGLTGPDLRPGLEDFFAKFEGLQHTFLADPKSVGPNTVQYPFSKSWNSMSDDGNLLHNHWSSIDPEKPRDRVERLDFNQDGLLVRVAVVDSSAPLEPLL